MIAYHGNADEKTRILTQLEAHAAADEIIKGVYWEHGRGCAIGCAIHSDDHAEYESRFGIPQMLARLEDTIFEGLPNEKAKAWPMRFMGAIRPGADLSRVGWQFLHWLLTNVDVNPGIHHETVRDSVARCAEVVDRMVKGLPVTEADADAAASWAARSAVESARSAWSAWSAWSARSAAESAAESAAWSAKSAAWSARSAAESAAESAAWSAAMTAARDKAYAAMSDKLVELLEAA